VKIRPVGGEMYHADGWRDGRTDMTKIVVALRNFAKAPIMIPKLSNIKDTFSQLGLRSFFEKSKRLEKQRLHRCTVLFTVHKNTKKLLNKPIHKN
jgi:hypothetical protein